MAMKDTVGSPAAKADLPPFVNWGQEQTLALQKELLASYEQLTVFGSLACSQELGCGQIWRQS
jgi:hypothetical protein